MTSPVANFTDSDEVQVLKPAYILALPSILQKVRKRTLANYLIWRVIDESAPYLSTDIRQLSDHFHDIDQTRLDHCQELLLHPDNGIPIGTNALYFRKYVNTDKIKDVEDLIKHVAGQLDVYINQVC